MNCSLKSSFLSLMAVAGFWGMGGMGCDSDNALSPKMDAGVTRMGGTMTAAGGRFASTGGTTTGGTTSGPRGGSMASTVDAGRGNQCQNGSRCAADCDATCRENGANGTRACTCQNGVLECDDCVVTIVGGSARGDGGIFNRADSGGTIPWRRDGGVVFGRGDGGNMNRGDGGPVFGRGDGGSSNRRDGGPSFTWPDGGVFTRRDGGFGMPSMPEVGPTF